MAHILKIDTTRKIADWVECPICGNNPRTRDDCNNPECENGFVLKHR